MRFVIPDLSASPSPNFSSEPTTTHSLFVEELNYHGTLNGTSPERGANFGYPDCFAAWDPSVIPNGQNIKVGTQFAIGSGNDATCAQRTAPKLCFPSHTAPLSVRFNSNSTAAYITFHGSWYVPIPLLCRFAEHNPSKICP